MNVLQWIQIKNLFLEGEVVGGSGGGTKVNELLLLRIHI